MSHAIMFDTLAYAKKLKTAGFTEEQAEVQAEAMAELVDEKLATKQDIRDLSRDIKALEAGLKRDMKEMEERTRTDAKEQEMRLTIRLGIVQAASIAIIATLVKIL